MISSWVLALATEISGRAGSVHADDGHVALAEHGERRALESLEVARALRLARGARAIGAGDRDLTSHPLPVRGPEKQPSLGCGMLGPPPREASA
jgi:hypothetical protein